MKNVIFLLFMLTFSISSFAQHNMDQRKETDKLMDASRHWAASVPTDQFFNFISPEGVMMPPDNGSVKGHEGIGKLLGEFKSLPGFSITWEPQEAFVAKSGDLGYTVDRILVNFKDQNGKKVDLFEKGVTIWKKDSNGDWKMAIDIWNVDPSITSIYK